MARLQTAVGRGLGGLICIFPLRIEVSPFYPDLSIAPDWGMAMLLGTVIAYFVEFWRG